MSSADTVTFTAPLLAWRTERYGDIGYVAIAGAAAEAIGAHELARRLELGRRRGFGSVKVNVGLGESHWSTSVFPQKSGAWFLPVKKAICRAEGSRRATKSRCGWNCCNNWFWPISVIRLTTRCSR